MLSRWMQYWMGHPLRFQLALCAAAIFSLAFAYTSQYGFGLHPCIMCLYQRIPYAVVIGLTLVALGLKKSSKVVGFIVLLSLLAFLVNTGLAFFHIGIEYEWWEGTGGCSAQLQADSLEALKAQIMGAPTASCKDVPFMFLGLSMAGWNMVWAAGIALVGLFGFVTITRKSVNK